MTILKSFLRDESGATAIEYGLIAAGISVAIIVTVQAPRNQAEHDVREHQQQAELTLKPRRDQKGSGNRRSLFAFGRSRLKRYCVSNWSRLGNLR